MHKSQKINLETGLTPVGKIRQSQFIFILETSSDLKELASLKPPYCLCNFLIQIFVSICKLNFLLLNYILKIQSFLLLLNY